MASNFFGNQFRITTWGESHGKSIGVVIDGCPSGIAISEELIFEALKKRRPGHSAYVSPRKEEDYPQILSGVFEGRTTGAPISILIENQDVDSSSYEPIKDLFRPGHANFTYLHKYGVFDYRGGGRASARETAARVAAGAVASALLEKEGIFLCAFLHEIGGIRGNPDLTNWDAFKSGVSASSLFFPDPQMEEKAKELLKQCSEEGDSIGGIVALSTSSLPIGLGDPVYEKLEANLAKAMLSIPASKGFEIGEGFSSASKKGSEHNDGFILDGKIKPSTNHAGGVLGGITTGEPLWLRVAFKPTSSIKKPQNTVNLQGESKVFSLPSGSRHDPCLAIRAVPVVEAMAAITLADALLMNARQP